MNARWLWIGVSAALCWPALGLAISPHRAVQHGNTSYQAQRYDEALQWYVRASQSMPEAAEIDFNQGNVYYKQRDYRKALEFYASALRLADSRMASRITYNLGNVAYQQALLAMERPQEALQHLRSAMTYYRNSLQLQPDQQAARYNLELAMRLRDQLLRREQRQSEAPDRHRQKRDNQRPQGSQPQRQQASQPEPAPEQDQGQPGHQAAQSQAPPDGGSAGIRQAPAPPQFSPEEAAQRLDVIRQRARKIDELRRQWRRARMRDARIDKYW